MRERHALGLALLVGLFAPAWAWAQEAPTAPSGAPCGASRSAIASVVTGVARGLRGAPQGVVVVAAPLASDEATVDGPALVGRLATQVAGRLGGTYEEGWDLPRARAEAPAVVHLEAVVQRGRLRLAADAYLARRSVWSRARGKGGPVAHVHVHAPLDAEVRGFLAPVDFAPQPSVAKYPGVDRDVLALACGDLDGDGVPELFTSTRERVAAVKLHPEGAEVVASTDWNQVPMSPVPWRDPIAFLTVVEPHAGGHLAASVSDREGHVRLVEVGGEVQRGAGMAVPHGHGTACTGRYDLRLGGSLKPCRRGEGVGLETLGRRGDAMASAVQVERDGAAKVVVAVREKHVLHLVDSDGDRAFGRVGAQIAVGDLDQDGALETLHSYDVGLRSRDGVEVRTVREGADGGPGRRYRIPVPTGVEAVAVCPPDRPGQVAAWALATRGELWVVR